MHSLDVADIWLTQKKLNRIHIVIGLVRDLEEFGTFREPILLNVAEDGEYEVLNGHHRLFAYYLFGRTSLTVGEFVLHYQNKSRRRFGLLRNI